MNNNSLGQRIKELRKLNHMTQVELGRLSGIHHTNIGRIENKGVVPQADVLYLIAKSLGTTVTWLLTGEDIPLNINNTCSSSAVDTINPDSMVDEINLLACQLTESEKNEVILFIKYMIFHRSSVVKSYAEN